MIQYHTLLYATCTRYLPCTLTSTCTCIHTDMKVSCKLIITFVRRYFRKYEIKYSSTFVRNKVRIFVLSYFESKLLLSYFRYDTKVLPSGVRTCTLEST